VILLSRNISSSALRERLSTATPEFPVLSSTIPGGVVLPEIPQCVAAAKTHTPERYMKLLTWGPGVEMGLCCATCSLSLHF